MTKPRQGCETRGRGAATRGAAIWTEGSTGVDATAEKTEVVVGKLSARPKWVTNSPVDSLHETVIVLHSLAKRAQNMAVHPLHDFCSMQNALLAVVPSRRRHQRRRPVELAAAQAHSTSSRPAPPCPPSRLCSFWSVGAEKPRPPCVAGASGRPIDLFSVDDVKSVFFSLAFSTLDTYSSTCGVMDVMLPTRFKAERETTSSQQWLRSGFAQILTSPHSSTAS